MISRCFTVNSLKAAHSIWVRRFCSLGVALFEDAIACHSIHLHPFTVDSIAIKGNHLEIMCKYLHISSKYSYDFVFFSQKASESQTN